MEDPSRRRVLAMRPEMPSMSCHHGFFGPVVPSNSVTGLGQVSIIPTHPVRRFTRLLLLYITALSRPFLCYESPGIYSISNSV